MFPSVPGHGDDCHPDCEDGGETVAPTQDTDTDQTNTVHLFCACVVQTTCDQVSREHDALGVVAPVGR